MKINELKRIAEENDYKLEKLNDRKEIILTRRVSIDGFLANFITISLDFENQIWIKNINCSKKDITMIKAAVEFVETPLEDRVEEKKFYLKHRWLVQAGDYKTGFLNYDTNNDILFIYSEHHTHLIKTQFTLEEIFNIREKFNTDLFDFELVEVEE